MTTGTGIFLSTLALCIMGVISTWLEKKGNK